MRTVRTGERRWRLGRRAASWAALAAAAAVGAVASAADEDPGARQRAVERLVGQLASEDAERRFAAVRALAGVTGPNPEEVAADAGADGDGADGDDAGGPTAPTALLSTEALWDLSEEASLDASQRRGLRQAARVRFWNTPRAAIGISLSLDAAAGGGIEVDRAHRQFPAGALGLVRDGDVITRIDGRDVTELPANMARMTLQRTVRSRDPGDPLALTVRRRAAAGVPEVGVVEGAGGARGEVLRVNRLAEGVAEVSMVIPLGGQERFDEVEGVPRSRLSDAVLSWAWGTWLERREIGMDRVRAALEGGVSPASVWGSSVGAVNTDPARLRHSPFGGPAAAGPTPPEGLGTRRVVLGGNRVVRIAPNGRLVAQRSNGARVTRSEPVTMGESERAAAAGRLYAELEQLRSEAARVSALLDGLSGDPLAASAASARLETLRSRIAELWAEAAGLTAG